jgi:hypothetical protein
MPFLLTAAEVLSFGKITGFRTGLKLRGVGVGVEECAMIRKPACSHFGEPFQWQDYPAIIYHVQEVHQVPGSKEEAETRAG